VSDVLISVEEEEVSFDFDAVLVKSSKDDSVAIVDLGLPLKLVILPLSEDLIAIPVMFRQFPN
jgi:hypothetical protein